MHYSSDEEKKMLLKAQGKGYKPVHYELAESATDRQIFESLSKLASYSQSSLFQRYLFSQKLVQALIDNDVLRCRYDKEGMNVNRRAIMTHIGGESASKIDPPEQTL